MERMNILGMLHFGKIKMIPEHYDFQARHLLFQGSIFRFKMLVFVGCKTEAQLIMALHTFCLEPYAIWEAHSNSDQSWKGLSISKRSPTGAT